MNNLFKLPVHLSRPQIKKLIEGKGIMLAPHLFANEQLPQTLAIAKKTHTRAQRNKRNGKGIRIQLTPDEIEASGIMDWLKKGYNFVKKNVIDTKNYQKYAKPLIRHAIDLAPIPSDVKKVVDYVGKQTNAYGVKKAKLVKGSQEARDYMAHLRSLRKTKKGGSFRAF